MAHNPALWIGAALVSIALAGCATPIVYGPLAAGTGFGYSDFANADGSHTILAVGASAPQAHEFWDRRAQEICGGLEYRKNIFRAEIPIVTGAGYASNAYNPSYGTSYTYDMYGAFNLEGYLHCQGQPTPGQSAAEGAADAAPAPVTPPVTP